MANQIAANYRHLADEDAAAAVAGHLRRFWSPAMRDDLVVGRDDADLDEVVRRAAALLGAGAASA